MDEDFIRKAADLAVSNVRSGTGGPFAALVVKGGRVIGEGVNRVTTSNDPTSHAEINAIRSACRALESYHLRGCVLYTTCEPCPMCLGAVYWARLDRVYYSATRKEAKAAGFDDEHIFKEIARPISERSIEMIRTLPEAARRIFRAWNDKSDRIPY